MKRELYLTETKGDWKEYVIRSKVGEDYDFQGGISLPFNRESKENSEEILKLISSAFGESK